MDEILASPGIETLKRRIARIAVPTDKGERSLCAILVSYGKKFANCSEFGAEPVCTGAFGPDDDEVGGGARALAQVVINWTVTPAPLALGPVVN